MVGGGGLLNILLMTTCLVCVWGCNGFEFLLFAIFIAMVQKCKVYFLQIVI